MKIMIEEGSQLFIDEVLVVSNDDKSSNSLLKSSSILFTSVLNFLRSNQS